MTEFTHRYRIVGNKIVSTFTCDNTPEGEAFMDYLLDTALDSASKASCKPENRPSDDGKTSKGLDIPESPNDDWNRWKNSVSQKEFEALAELVDSIHDWAVEELIDLNGRVKIIEARVRELEARLSPVDTKSGE